MLTAEVIYFTASLLFQDRTLVKNESAFDAFHAKQYTLTLIGGVKVNCRYKAFHSNSS